MALRPFLTGLFVELQHHLFPDSALLEASEMVIDSFPRGKVLGKHAPLASCFVDVEDGIENLPHAVAAHCSPCIRASSERF